MADGGPRLVVGCYRSTGDCAFEYAFKGLDEDWSSTHFATRWSASKHWHKNCIHGDNGYYMALFGETAMKGITLCDTRIHHLTERDVYGVMIGMVDQMVYHSGQNKINAYNIATGECSVVKAINTIVEKLAFDGETMMIKKSGPDGKYPYQTVDIRTGSSGWCTQPGSGTAIIPGQKNIWYLAVDHLSAGVYDERAGSDKVQDLPCHLPYDAITFYESLNAFSWVDRHGMYGFTDVRNMASYECGQLDNDLLIKIGSRHPVAFVL